MTPTKSLLPALTSRCAYELRLFFTALQFFTRLPVPRWVGFEPEWLHHASRYFPTVGILVGAVASGVYLACVQFFPPAVAVLLSTMAGIYLTGAFHEDGFADVCDGFGGGYTPDRVLEIMKDSRIGAYGTIGIGLLLALKCVSLSYTASWAVAGALLVAHPLSRAISVSLIWRLTYIKAEGKAKPLAHRMSTLGFCIAVITALVPVVAVVVAGALQWYAVAAGAAAAMLAAAWLTRVFLRRIGGYTGDCLGAVQQVSEVAFYLGMLAAIRP